MKYLDAYMASPEYTGYIASWLILGLSLISKFLVASIAIYLITAASDWPRLFLHPGCFCLALSLHGKFHNTNMKVSHCCLLVTLYCTIIFIS